MMMTKERNIISLSFSIISIISICPTFVFTNCSNIARRARNPDTEIKVFRDLEGNSAALIIPEDAYVKQGFNIPKEIPNEALLQVGVNIQPRGATSFRTKEEILQKAHVHTPAPGRESPRREMFIIKEGIAKLTFYSKDGQVVQEKTLYPGDIAFITEGHSVEFLTDCKVIEIKEGPYPDTPEEDKIWLKLVGTPALDGSNFTGFATSFKKDGGFMDPVDILKIAVENNFVGPVQVILDEQAMNKIDELKRFAKEQNIPLLVHSFLGMRKLSNRELVREMQAASNLLEGQETKRVVFHYDPQWQKEELISYIIRFNEYGLIPCVENPIGDFEVYRTYISVLSEIAPREDLKFDLVIDIGKLYTSESGLGEANTKTFLTQMLELARDNNRKVIVHLMDSSNPNYGKREWVPIGEGCIPYGSVVETLSSYSKIITFTIFEYEDMNNTLRGNGNWLNLVHSSEEISYQFGRGGDFLDAVIRSGFKEFRVAGVTGIDIPVHITEVNGAQIVRWRNNGYEVIYLKSGSMAVNLSVDGKLKQVELHQGDTILLVPDVWINIY